MRQLGEEREQPYFNAQTDVLSLLSGYLISWLDRELEVQFSPFDANYPAAVGRQP